MCTIVRHTEHTCVCVCDLKILLLYECASLRGFGRSNHILYSVGSKGRLLHVRAWNTRGVRFFATTKKHNSPDSSTPCTNAAQNYKKLHFLVNAVLYAYQREQVLWALDVCVQKEEYEKKNIPETLNNWLTHELVGTHLTALGVMWARLFQRQAHIYIQKHRRY